MPRIFSLSNLKSYSSLIRLQYPTGYLLCFFPSCYGLLLAYEEISNFLYVILFFIGAVITRGLGCIINDIFDRDIDQKVERTKTRPIASGAISVFEALLFAIILASMSLGILLSLTESAIYIGFFAIILIIIYPLMKRITYYPQIFLGFAFNTGCLIGYASIKDTLSLEAIILYIACGFWTIAYDAIYAFSDIEDDKLVGVKSIAIILESRPYKNIIFALYASFFSIFTFIFYEEISIIGFILIACSVGISIWSINTLDIGQKSNCLYRFKINNYIGLLLFLAIALEKI